MLRDAVAVAACFLSHHGISRIHSDCSGIVLAATYEYVPAVGFNLTGNNNDIIVASGCSTCNVQDACAAHPLAELCERRCQTEQSCVGFYVSDDGVCCPVKSRPKVTADVKVRMPHTHTHTHTHIRHYYTHLKTCETKFCSYFERKGVLWLVSRPLPSQNPLHLVTPLPQTCRAIWMVRNGCSCTRTSPPGRAYK